MAYGTISTKVRDKNIQSHAKSGVCAVTIIYLLQDQ